MLSLQRLHRFHNMTLYASVVLSFLAVAKNGPGILLIALFSLSIPLSWYAHAKQWTHKVPNQVWNVLVLSVIAFTGAQLYLTDTSIINSGIRFIIMLVLIKLFSRKGPRDDWQLYALSFLLMSAGTAVNEDLTYGLIFGLYVVVCTFGLSMFHITTELGITKITLQKTPLTRLYMTTLIVLSVGVFASSVGIFFAFPRVGLGFFATKTRQASSMVGFSDQVNLGSHGVIRDNPTVAMRVEFPNNQQPPDYSGFHWRMMVFDRYTGTGWQRSHKGKIKSIRDRGKGKYTLEKTLTKALLEELKTTPTLPTMQIYLEPLGTNQIPTLWPAKSIHLGVPGLNVPFNPNMGSIQVNTFDEVMYLRRNKLAVQYEMVVHDTPKKTKLLTVPLTNNPSRLPPDLDLKRLSNLAKDITKGATSDHERAVKIQTYLETNYKYTTNLPVVDQSNPIESFLFTTKTGHCEYYATAMALMLQSLGINARLVNGFLGGRWYGNYLAVRQGDAHSWVEVELEPFGWVPFDPTPAGEANNVFKDNALQKWFHQNYDAMKFGWNKWIIEYSIDAQIDALKQLGNVLSPKSSFISSGSDGASTENNKKEKLPIRTLVFYLGFGIICLGAWYSQRAVRHRAIILWGLVGGFWVCVGVGWMWWFKGQNTTTILVGALCPFAASLLAHFKRTEQQHNARAQSHALFIKLERIAKKQAALQRDDDEGPDAFIQRLIQTYPTTQDDLVRFRKRYLAARFGEQPLSAQEIRALTQLLKRLNKQLGQKTIT